jgi:hypothetical protein
MTDLFDKTILVAGGDGDKCAAVARGYGFKNVVTPADLVVAHPEIWPFSKGFKPTSQAHRREQQGQQP